MTFGRWRGYLCKVKRTRKWSAKIGSGASTVVVLRGAPSPRVGLRVKFRELDARTPERNLPWQSGRVREFDTSVPRVFIDRE